MNLPKDKLSDDAIKNIEIWLTEPKYQEYKLELENMIAEGRWQELEDSFFKKVEFGTAGCRGTTGIGANRINRVTIGEAAQALCDYAISVDDEAKEKGIAICYDMRLSSPELSRVAAEVVAANGFKTYIFDGFRATPELSFTVRYLKCIAGIVISASHNPPADNGFKAYWSDGCQLVAPQDKGIVERAAQVSEIKRIDYDDAVSSGEIVILGKDVDEAYLAATTDEVLGEDRDVDIVYSPLHGTGQTNVLPTLRAVGFDKISLVEAQMVPDGNFPTIPSGKPNPGELPANDMAVAQMMKEGADIAITNDPDADRVGVIVRQGDRPIYLSGNQAVALAAAYALEKLKSKGQLTPQHFLAKTIVTTDLLDALANFYGVKVYGNMLIGFKYIGRLMTSKEGTEEKFILGGEESLGLLKGTYARDKDGATGALPLAEYAAELKKQGKTLYDKLLELFIQHGLYVEKLVNISYPGAAGFSKMQKIMKAVHENPPKEVGGQKVTAVIDYKTLQKTDLLTGFVTPVDCDKGDVVVLEFGSHSNRVTVRPSGTEPQIRFYVQQYEKVVDPIKVEARYQELDSHMDAVAKQLSEALSNS